MSSTKIFFQIILTTLIIISFCQDLFSSGEFCWARAKIDLQRDVNDYWRTHQDYDLMFLSHLSRLTTFKVKEEINVVDFHDLKNVCRFPFVFITAEGEPDLSDTEIRNIREFLRRGGFIYADDCVVNESGDYFFTGMKKVIEEKIFPGAKMRKLPDDHEIYKSFFSLPGLPHMQGVDYKGWGYFDEDGRMKIFLTGGDIHCGWTTEHFGEEKSMSALKMGINIVIYALTH